MHGPFNAYVKPFLREKKMSSLPLQPYRGSRFNILFENAAHVFLLRKEITTFLQGYQTNRLLQAVLHDIKTPEYLAGCKTLGLICHQVTLPLWCLIEDKTVSIFQMNGMYLKLVAFLDEATRDIQTFMQGELYPFDNAGRGIELDELLKPWEHDHLVEGMLGVVFPAMKKTLPEAVCRSSTWWQVCRV